MYSVFISQLQNIKNFLNTKYGCMYSLLLRKASLQCNFLQHRGKKIKKFDNYRNRKYFFTCTTYMCIKKEVGGGYSFSGLHHLVILAEYQIFS